MLLFPWLHHNKYCPFCRIISFLEYYWAAAFYPCRMSAMFCPESFPFVHLMHTYLNCHQSCTLPSFRIQRRGSRPRVWPFSRITVGPLESRPWAKKNLSQFWLNIKQTKEKLLVPDLIPGTQARQKLFKTLKNISTT